MLCAIELSAHLQREFVVVGQWRPTWDIDSVEIGALGPADNKAVRLDSS
jgi:hypothetical protein